MCKVCDDIKGKPLDQALQILGKAVHAGPSKHLDEVLDKLLGSEDRSSDDPALALEWEQRRREEEI